MLTLTISELEDLRQHFLSLIIDLTSEKKLDIECLDDTLNHIASILKVNMGYKPLTIERKSESLKLLNSYLNGNSYEKIKQHLETNYINF